MAGLPARMDAPMIAVILMCALLIAGLVVVGIVVFARWILQRRRS